MNASPAPPEASRLPDAPWTRGLLIVLGVVQAIVAMLPDTMQNTLVFSFGLVPAVLFDSANSPSVPAPLTLVTSLGLHAGWMHLAMNLLFLWFVGRPVEWVLGGQRWLLLFVLSGITGGLVQGLSNPLSPLPVIGASSGISGLFAAYLVFFSKSRPAPATILGLRISSHHMRLLGFLAAWLLIQGLMGLTMADSESGGIAIWAHVGGFAMGLVLAVPLVRTRGDARGS